MQSDALPPPPSPRERQRRDRWNQDVLDAMEPYTQWKWRPKSAGDGLDDFGANLRAMLAADPALTQRRFQAFTWLVLNVPEIRDLHARYQRRVLAQKAHDESLLRLIRDLEAELGPEPDDTGGR
jgi:hypothetical protein